ncbi:LOW QUALITY PROTEIN: hypothetical protein HID58_002001, partial [Brassica napus]
NRSSKKEYDSELKMVLECVSIAFTTWLDRREIVTLNCDVVPEQTAPQDSKKIWTNTSTRLEGEHSLNRKKWMIMMVLMNPQ